MCNNERLHGNEWHKLQSSPGVPLLCFLFSVSLKHSVTLLQGKFVRWPPGDPLNKHLWNASLYTARRSV